MGAIAQHDIQQDHAGGRIIHSFLHALNALCRVNHRMGLALGIGVIAQINNNVAVQLQHVAFDILRWNLYIHGILNQHRSFICQCAAGIICLNGLVFFLFEEFGFVNVHRSFRYGFPTYQADCQTCCLIQCIGMIEVFFMIFRLFTYKQGDNRLLADAQAVGNLLADLLCRRLGDDNEHLDAVIAFHGIDHVHHGDAADFCVQVTTTNTDGIGHAFSQTVNDGGQLLNAGAGCTDNADGARVNLVGKGNRYTLDDAGTAVRTHHRQTLGMCLFLQCLLILDGDVVTEHKHIHAQIQGTISFQCRISTRNRDNSQIGIRQLPQRLVPGLNAFLALLAGCSGILLLEECIRLLQDGIHHALIVDIRNDYHVICRGSHQLFRIQTALLEDVLVGRCCHHNGNLLHALDGRDVVCQQHQYN